MWITPKIDWTSADYYNYSDLNRVETNTDHIRSLLTQLGNVVTITVFTNRSMSYIEFADSLNRLENNINALGTWYKPTGWITPKTNWLYGDGFDYNDAKRLESNLLILEKFAQGNILNVKYAGTFACGEELI